MSLKFNQAELRQDKKLFDQRTCEVRIDNGKEFTLRLFGQDPEGCEYTQTEDKSFEAKLQTEGLLKTVGVQG